MPACSVCSNERGAFLRFLLQWRQCACTLRYCRKCFRALPKPASGKWWDRFDKLCKGGGGGHVFGPPDSPTGYYP